MADGIEIYFSESLTPGERELADQSIALMVERTRAEADAARTRAAEDDKLLDAIATPLAKLIRADPGAAEALEKLSKRRVEVEDSLSYEGPQGGARDDVIPVSPTTISVESRLPPYDFAWRWHGGAAPFNQIGDRGGRLGMDARAGPLNQVPAHHRQAAARQGP